MRNTCIEKGKSSFDELIGSVKDGLFCKNVFGGQTNGEMFTFTAAETYEIKNGKIGKMCQGSVLQGNVFDTLSNIDMVGTDFDQPDSVGGCGKGGQMPLPTSHGSPSIRIKKIVISGK
jgi:TldD protein